MMTDPIADMASRLRNGNLAFHPTVRMPHSKLKKALLDVLRREGRIRAVSEEADGGKKFLKVELAYGPNRERLMAGIRRVSRPGLRVFRGIADLPKPRAGKLSILTTSQGVLTGAEARKRKIGGELLLEVW